MSTFVQMAQLLAAASIAGGVVGLVVWLVVHNVRYTQRDLALKAAQLAPNVTVRKDQVLELLMQYAYDATGQRLVLERAWAACAPMPHIRATTMDSGRGVVFVPGRKVLTRRLEEEDTIWRGRWYPLTTRNAGILMIEKMRQIWALLANGSSLSSTERLLPYAEAWRVRFFERPFPVKRRHRWRRLALGLRRHR